MASACLNNVGLSPDSFIDCSAYGWLSPRVSFSRDLSDGESKLTGAKQQFPTTVKDADLLQFSDLDVSGKGVVDFEFCLEDPVTMLPADELFFNGKLMPLHVSTNRSVEALSSSENRSLESEKCGRKTDIRGVDSYLFSPKAPRCSSKWKELLGLKKLYQNSSTKHDYPRATASSFSNSSSNVKSLKHLLHRSSKSSSSASDALLNLPLLKDSDSESISISSRLSLSSSSSGHEHEDLPRLSLDTEKLNLYSIFQHKTTDLNPKANANPNVARMRPVKPRPGPLIDHPSATIVDRSSMRRVPAESCPVTHTGVTADSPRMNPSGKIVFQSLERSSSSPGSFNGGHKLKPRGMERSYSANVRVTPVLNVPVCSLRGSSKPGGVFGFGQLFAAPQKRENGSTNGGANNRSQQQNTNTRLRTDRI